MNRLYKSLLKGVRKQKTGHLGFEQEYYRLPGRIVFKNLETIEKDRLLFESWYLFTLWIRVKLGFI